MVLFMKSVYCVCVQRQRRTDPATGAEGRIRGRTLEQPRAGFRGMQRSLASITSPRALVRTSHVLNELELPCIPDAGMASLEPLDFFVL